MLIQLIQLGKNNLETTDLPQVLNSTSQGLHGGSGTNREGAAGSTLLHRPGWKAWLLSCNFPSYQQVMLLPIWRGKEGVFVSWGLVANATRLEACWLYREQWLLSL